LPDGAAIEKFSMDIDGKEMEAELLPADKARAIYEDIVRRHKDPALLEYVGKGAFRVRIFPIEPNGTKRVRLKYTQLLKSDSGLVEYTYPLNTEKFSSRPLKDVSVKVDLNCKRPIKSVYSPSHNVDVRRHGDRRATVGYEERHARPDTDFKLIFSRTDDPSASTCSPTARRRMRATSCSWRRRASTTWARRSRTATSASSSTPAARWPGRKWSRRKRPSPSAWRT
jgi:hypothetical protein